MPEDESKQISGEPDDGSQIIGPGAAPGAFTPPPDSSEPLGVHFVQLESRSGPLPDPATLAAYKELDEGLFHTIQEMAVSQASHLQELQRLDVQRVIDRERGGRDERRRGQWMGFCIAVAGLIVTLVLALTGHDAVAGVVGGATLATIVTAFIAGRVTRPVRRDQSAARGRSDAEP